MTETTERQWKVGDELAFRSIALHGGLYIKRIDEITKSGKLKCGSTLVNPKTMRIWGAGDSPKTTVYPATDEIRQEIARNRKLSFLCGMTPTSWRLLTDDQLDRIIAIVREGTQS